MTDTKRHKNWISIAFTLVIVLAFYWSTYSSIVSIWIRSDTFSHGFVIVPITMYLIWLKREEINPQTYCVEFVAVPFLLLAVVMWVLGQVAHVAVVQQFSAVALFPILAWLLMGREAARKIQFPLLYLFFAVPFGEFLVPILQDFTAAFTVNALRLVGIPVFWEGRYIILPSGNFEVAEACSGVRYLIASVALGTLYAYINYSSSKRRVIFILLSAIVPIIANGLRAFSIVVLAYFTDQEFGKGVDHLIYGWLFFGIVMFLLFWLGHKFRDDAKKADSAAGITGNTLPVLQSNSYRLSLFVISSVVLMSGPWVIFLMSGGSHQKFVLQESLPAAESNWSGPFDTNIEWKPTYVGTTFQDIKQYKKDNNTVWLYIAFYNGQSEGSEMVSSENKLTSSDLWHRVSERKQSIKLVGNGELSVNETAIKSNHQSLVLWQWFNIGGSTIDNTILAKIFELRVRFSREIPTSASVVIAAEYLDQPSEARLVLEDFVHDMLPAVIASVGK